MLYTRAVPRFDVHPPTAGTTGVCVLNVVVPNTVMAEVTTCSWAFSCSFQPLGCASEVVRIRIARHRW